MYLTHPNHIYPSNFVSPPRILTNQTHSLYRLPSLCTSLILLHILLLYLHFLTRPSFSFFFFFFLFLITCPYIFFSLLSIIAKYMFSIVFRSKTKKKKKQNLYVYLYFPFLQSMINNTIKNKEKKHYSIIIQNMQLIICLIRYLNAQ